MTTNKKEHHTNDERVNSSGRYNYIDRNERRNSNTIIVANFDIPLSIMNRTPRQKINKTISLHTIDQMDLIDIYIRHSTQGQQNIHSS